ncbi:MAG: inositol monophosphatase [Corynebacteriales bacterium]|nr:inositol monophosphatase [Mycobacteriales bacterium]
MDDLANELLELARTVALAGGAIAREGRDRALGAVTTKSTPTDVVTALDAEVEQFVSSQLRQARPQDAFIGEESVATPVRAGQVRWILDPIDGTVNYIYGHPQYALSLAAYIDDTALAAVVYNPASEELWHAHAGGGAWRGQLRLGGSPRRELSQALIGTGFSYDADRRREQGAMIARVLPQVRDIRRVGACAIDLCYVAEGRLDGFYERNVNIWDGAAGALICQEAGIRIGGWQGQPWDNEMLIAAPQPLFDAFHDALWAAHTAD